jgi:hypothetical protein
MDDESQKYQLNVGYSFLFIVGELMKSFSLADEFDTATRVNILRKLSLYIRVGAGKTFKKDLIVMFNEINVLLDLANITGKSSEIDAAKRKAQPLINELYVFLLDELNRRDLFLPKKTQLVTGRFKRDDNEEVVEGVAE